MKNFTNLFKHKTSPLWVRFIVMILMSFAGSAIAWGNTYDQSAKDLYFDNSESKWSNCYLYIGHNDNKGWTSCYDMSRVLGTQYLWTLSSSFNGGNPWNDADGWVVCKEKWWNSSEETIYKFVHHGNKNVTDITKSAWEDNKIYKTNGTGNVTYDNKTTNVYKVTSITKSNYTVTIKSATGGTLTVKDYDNATVSNGASKICLTVLKFSALASTEYTFKEVQINDGSTTTTIAAANLGSTTYTLKSAVTITPVWTANQYAITYKDKGNAAFSGIHASGYPTKHTYGTATTLKDPTRDGYNFLGWYTTSACTGDAVTSLGATAYTADITLYAQWEQNCSPATSIKSAEQQQDGTIKLEGDFTTCGAKYHGFQWRKSTADWCNDGDERQDFSNYVKIGNTEGGEGEVKDFTPDSGVTYVFRTYIYNNGSWIYSSETIEVSTCVTVEDPNITSNSPICLGSELALTLNERQDGVVYKIGNQEIFTEGNNKYSFVPQASGTGSLTVVASHEHACKDATYPKEIQYTVNALPSAPDLNTASSIEVCPGNLTLADYVNVAAGTTVKWYSNENCTEEATSPSITAGGSKKFYAKAVNSITGCVSSEKTELTITAYSAPADFTLTTIPTEICSGADVVISISDKQDGVTYKLGETEINESITVNPTQTTTYTVVASLDVCPALTNSISTAEIVVNPIPSFVTAPSNLSLCKGATNVTDLTELSHVVVENGDPVWYDAETAGNVVTEGADLINGGTYWVAAENSTTGCVNREREQFVLTINNLPDTPLLGNKSASLCQSNETEDLDKLAEINDVVWYIGENEVNNAHEISLTTVGITTYTAKAVDANGCQSATGVDFTLTVNPLPTITSISASNDKPVLFEDVELTATGENIDKVEWTVNKGTITKDATDPKKAILTYDQTGTVTVTATATSEDGCTSAATKTVTFSAEVCNNVADMTKIYFDTKGNSNFNDNVYLSVAGNTYNKNRSADCNNTDHAGDYWPGEDGTFHKMTKIAGTNIYYVNKPASIPSGRISIWNKNQQGYEKVWQAHVILAKSIDNNNNCLVLGSSTYHETRESNVYCSTWTTYKDAPAITAPAVKTVSVTSDEDGNVTMVGQVVKTGCDTQAILGLQYKKQNPDGTTYEANYTTYPNPGTKEAISAGKTFTVTTKLEDGTYKVRARIDNSHATNGYGEDIIVVVNTTKTPISNVEIKYSDIDGKDDIDNPNPMCKGAIAYVKLSYVGSRYSDIKWLVEGVETNLVTDEGDGVWSYEIQGDGSLSVELRNDANTDPAWPYSNKLAFTIIPEPTAPYISIDPASGVICQGSSATIKVTNPTPDCAYKLVEKGSEADFTPYESGYLTYEVSAVGNYYVVAQHNACTANEYTSNQVAINQIISTNANISIEPANAETTPWEPVTITVKPDAGYIYELSYTEGNLAAVDGVRIKQNGDSYTYYIPRPDAWTTGDSNPVRTPINYGIKAQLKVDGEESECKLNHATATIQLKDEDNENCPKKQEP